MKKLILEYENDEDFKAIENAFEVIKKGGSKLKSKEDMCKLIIKKDVAIADMLFHLKND